MTEAVPLRSVALAGFAACLMMVTGCQRTPAKTESAAEAAKPAAQTAAASVITLAPPFKKDTGFAWVVTTDVDPATRKLKVFEDGKELGPGDSLHDAIRTKGLGAYSHWDAKAQGFAVYFSTSDNSDPNTNGRTYTLR